MDAALELDERHAVGIEVRLLWDPRDRALTVVAHDLQTDETFVIDVEPDQALDVFQHPFAYAKQPAPRTAVRVETS